MCNCAYALPMYIFRWKYSKRWSYVICCNNICIQRTSLSSFVNLHNQVKLLITHEQWAYNSMGKLFESIQLFDTHLVQ